jgi:hypothetical protein
MTDLEYAEGIRIIDEIRRHLPTDVRNSVADYKEYYIKTNKPTLQEEAEEAPAPVVKAPVAPKKKGFFK